jgi:hypothetical protein
VEPRKEEEEEEEEEEVIKQEPERRLHTVSFWLDSLEVRHK